MQTKQIVDQALKTPNSIGGRTGAFADRRTAQGADLMRYKTLLAERSQSLSAGWAPVPKSAAMPKARNACRQAPAPATIWRFVFRQTSGTELQPGNLPLGCAGLLRLCPQGQTQPGQGVRSNSQSRDVFQGYAGMLSQKLQDAIRHRSIKPCRPVLTRRSDKRAKIVRRYAVGVGEPVQPTRQKFTRRRHSAHRPTASHRICIPLCRSDGDPGRPKHHVIS